MQDEHKLQCLTAPCCIEYLIVPELVNDGLMEKKFDVFEEVESPCCCGPFVYFLLMLWLMRVNPLQDTQPPVTNKQMRCKIPQIQRYWMAHTLTNRIQSFPPLSCCRPVAARVYYAN